MLKNRILFFIELSAMLMGLIFISKEYFNYQWLSSFWVISAAEKMPLGPDGTFQTDSSPVEILSEIDQEKVKDDLKININLAANEDLQSLPRIGPKTAEQIIQRRESHGPFKTLEDLLQVKGIGPSTLERLRDKIKLLPSEIKAKKSDEKS